MSAKHLAIACLTLLLSIHSLASSKHNQYGPVARDCAHDRIICIEGNNHIFAVKGPLTGSQVNNLCPSTPKQTSFKRNRLPPNMLQPMIIVNAGKNILAYKQDQNRVHRSPSSEGLPSFSYILCGTADNKPNSGLHTKANNPISFDTFLSKSFAISGVHNAPSNEAFMADDRKFAYREVALKDSLAYVTSLFPTSEVNYEIFGNYIAGYQFTADYQDISARFDKEERLYEFISSTKKDNIPFITTLNEFVSNYGNSIVKGSATLEHDLDPKNNVSSGTYIWKLRGGSYLTLTINNAEIKLKMVNINLAEQTAEYVRKAKRLTAQDQK